ncbi:acyl-CoA dehydratase activase-related protein [Bifidobacterium sp.]|jgi:predicted CoA-substrate-specific enzyme activase|uniref:acyl-CoA dehydratase activase-related protein n=1 Tax=Bifidobacterium sp. TaxID=41200 RepID=UPI0025C3EBB6|nr:acyl-CoA dehydratase activase-related protein [Bifidobacterium sp.]MCI1636241.1 acyl-CoA dehydratase activase-related protein [Bifidobacterium sp.]
MTGVKYTKTADTDRRLRPLRVGLDVGSTTVKAVVLGDSNRLSDALFSDYRRHHANVRRCVAQLLGDILESLSRSGQDSQPIQVTITGSGGLGLAKQLGVEFVQEVIAETEAINTTNPEADVIIELGGEDAKITYLKPTPEQRMNGSCAGGTGAFIDQMATLLNVDAQGLNQLASRHKTIYPIASRCGVFAKSDLQPLINDGADKTDLAASIFSAVATQTISGLACGRPIRGNVVFLGGPLFFMPELRNAFATFLEGKAEHYIVPEDAHLFVAYGAALMAQDEMQPNAEQTVTAHDDTGKDTHFTFEELHSLRGIIAALHMLESLPSQARTLRPFFLDDAEREAFNQRHAQSTIPFGKLEQAHGPLFLGIDAGSTTIKATVVDDDNCIVWSTYATHQENPLLAAADIVRSIQEVLPKDCYIARSCATGYGEGLITAGLHVDEGVVETMAHYRAAEEISPGVTSVIDIGGQDMKFMSVTSGVIDSICVNEACSSGCGSFLQTFAQSLGISIQEFTQQALASKAPVDLGSRCTVFMNSSVKQAQKEGATPEDIAAGLCYSVVRNALYKVIKLRDSQSLGSTVVVQGGTFLNDAVLRAFELLTGREVTRPNIAGLMGAYGAALTARIHCVEEESAAAHNQLQRSSILMGADLDGLSMDTTHDVCNLCQNHCKLTITQFQDGSHFVTGNRCERGGDKNKQRSDRPNLYDFKYKRAFAYRRLTPKKATRGDIGIPRALNMYEDYPFWFTLLTSLGFRVMISGRSNHEVFERGMDSIASENICYPAKLVHGHIESLLDKGIHTIFYPCVTYEQELAPDTDNRYNCPVVAHYPVVIEANLAGLQEPDVRFLRPYINLSDRNKLIERIVDIFSWTDVSEEEARIAVAAAYREDAVFKNDIRQEGLRALAYMREHQTRGIVLAGRPYHVDPEINHGIPETICSLGMVVLSEDSICELNPKSMPDFSAFVDEDGQRALESNKNADGFRKTVPAYEGHQRLPLRVENQWAYHSRLYEAARFVGGYKNLQLVQMVSFGCGIDAITTDQVQEILADKNDVYTQLKIDEVSNLGAAKIRLRSLKAAMEERDRSSQDELSSAHHVAPRSVSPSRASEISETASTTTSPEHRVETQEPSALSRYANVRPFSKEMGHKYTVLAPQMSPVHFSLLESVFRSGGYDFRLLQTASQDDINTGTKFVNNDACFPAIIIVGQLVNAFLTGTYDPHKCAVIVTQTGGMCRATNYFGLLRKAMEDAGFGYVPIITLSVNGLNANPGLKATPTLLHRAVKAFYLGDALMECLLRVRPYEMEQGAANELYSVWNTIIRESLEHHGYSETAKNLYGFGKMRYAKLMHNMITAFDKLPLQNIERKPRVGVVGEILVKYHPDANNHVIDVIEDQDCEAVLPGICDFMINGISNAEWNEEHLGTGGKTWVKKLALNIAEQYRKPMLKALRSTHGKFDVPVSIQELRQKASTVTSLGVQAGEGWLLTGEIVDLVQSGTPNIICAQPFACLPNHVTGRGIFGKIRREYPSANIVSIDYDPGASQANQLNRIKLMIAAAKKNEINTASDSCCS